MRIAIEFVVSSALRERGERETEEGSEFDLRYFRVLFWCLVCLPTQLE